MRDRRHHYTTLTNASTGLRRQGEHSSLALNSCQALDSSTRTRYLELLLKMSRVLLTLL